MTSRFGWSKMPQPKVHANRRPADLYPTPEEATRALLKVIKFCGLVWEPASGLGHISRVFEAAGHKVRSTDLHATTYQYGGQADFLSQSVKAPNIVTNPPYKHALEFIRVGSSLANNKLALFLPVNFLNNIGTVKLLSEIGHPHHILVLVPTLKIDMGPERGIQRSIFHHCWCVWDKTSARQQHSNLIHIDWRV